MKENQVEMSDIREEVRNGRDAGQRFSSLSLKQVAIQQAGERGEIPRQSEWHQDLSSSTSKRLQSILDRSSPITDFSVAAFKIRALIGIFLNDSVNERECIGFYNQREKGSQVTSVSADLLLSSFIALRAFLESELVHSQKDEHITQIYCDTHHSLEDVIEITRKASTAEGGVREEYVEPLAFELLEFRAVLVSKALELGAHIVSSRVQAEVSVNTIESEPEALILTIREDSLLHQMLERQAELRKEVLPSIQKTALTVVQHLLAFIEKIRDQDVQRIGFDPKGMGKHDPISAEVVLDHLRETLYQLDDHFEALSEETPMDVNFRAYLHNMSHFIGVFRIALIRQKRNGYIPEGAFEVVQQQAQYTFREVTQAVKQLTTIANVDLFESESGGVLRSAGKVA